MLLDQQRAREMTEHDLELTGAADRREVERFARSLVSKRRREAERLMPLAVDALGSTFKSEFDLFASRNHPKGINKPLEDAVAFCAYLGSHSNLAHIKAAAVFERTRLRFFARQTRLAVCFRPRTQENGQTGRRRRISVWFRIGSVVRHFVV